MKIIYAVNQEPRESFTLSLDDLDIRDVRVEALTSDLTKGLPEMSASKGTNGCCSCNPSN
jgi:hypothetical protein